jgi:hypothetical protein
MGGHVGQVEHEEGLVKAFVIRSKQAPMIDLLRKPKRRRDVLITRGGLHTSRVRRPENGTFLCAELRFAAETR